MGALLVNLGRESGSHDAPLLFSVSHTSQGSPAGIATTLRDPPKSVSICWKKGVKAGYAFAVALTCGYRTNVVDALVTSDLITDGEADIVTVHLGAHEALADVSDRSLLEEIAVRLESRVQVDEPAFMLSFHSDAPSLAEATALTVIHCLENGTLKWHSASARRTKPD